jgi:hypothetical protein
MSQPAVERVLGRLLTDAEFRREFLARPAEVCRHQGFDLTPVELAALSRVDQRALRTLAAHLDPKIVRAIPLHLGDGEGRLGSSGGARDRRSQRGAG